MNNDIIIKRQIKHFWRDDVSKKEKKKKKRKKKKKKKKKKEKFKTPESTMF